MVRRARLVAAVLVISLGAGGLSACSNGGALTLTTYFSDSGDLQSRGGIQVADVRVGTIGKINLTKDFRAKVQLHLNVGVKVPRNSQAVLRTTSLLGEKFVELRPLGNPTQGPFLQNGDTVTQSVQAPELEFVAQTAVQLLAGVNASSVASIIQTGAQAFGTRGPELGALIGDLNQLSATLASRTTQIGQVIDNLDRATQTLAAGSPDLAALLTNLAQATTLLANDRNQVVTGLASLTHLAKAADYSLNKYQADIEPRDQAGRRGDRRPGQRPRRRVHPDRLVAEVLDRIPHRYPGRLRAVVPPGGPVHLRPTVSKMKRSRVRLNLLFFGILFLVLLVEATRSVITIGQITHPYRLNADFTNANGVLAHDEVDYLGVPIGEVSGVDRIPGGVVVHMAITKGHNIPGGSVANLDLKSAIGEQYINFQPPAGYQGNHGPYYPAGFTVPVAYTTTPVQFADLLRSANSLLTSIPPDAIASLLHELAVGLNGNTDALRTLVQSGDRLSGALVTRTQALNQLLTDSTKLVHVVTDHRDALTQQLSDLRQLAATLQSIQPTTNQLLDTANPLFQTVANLLAAQQGHLDCTLKGINPILDLLTTPRKQKELTTLLDVGP